MLLLLFRIFGPTSSLKELDHELAAFVNHYKDSSWWWITSFVTSVVALTIGATPGLPIDVVLLGIFFIPAIIHFSRYFPFSLNCEYRSSSYSEETANTAIIDEHSECEITLMIETGSNIDEFSFRLEIPSGLEARNIPTKATNIELTEDDYLVGTAIPGKGGEMIELILEETTGIPRGGANMVIRDDSSGRHMTTIKILPNSSP